MASYRCLLAACVMLGHACDSKRSGQPAPSSEPITSKQVAPGKPLADLASTIALPTVDRAEPLAARGFAVVAPEGDGFVVEGEPLASSTLAAKLATIEGDTLHVAVHRERTCEAAFAILMAAPKRITKFVLVVRDASTTVGLPVRFSSTDTADGPGMVAEIGRNGDVDLWSVSGTEGTSGKPKLVTRLDDAGKNALRAALSDIATRTGAKRMDLLVDRSLSMQVLVDALATVRTAFPDVRIAAGVPTIPSVVKMTIRDSDVEDDLAPHAESLQRCIKEWMKKEGGDHGVTLAADITVDKQGKVVGASFAGEAAPPLLVQCMTEATRAWKLAAPPGKYKFNVLVKIE